MDYSVGGLALPAGGSQAGVGTERPFDPARLSAGQREAALAPDGPLLIAAGPGTGKTTTVAARIAHLVTTGRAPPTGILALAFTRAAARTLTTRLGAWLGAAGAAIHATTFHAFGLWLVQRWPEALGYGPEPLVVYRRPQASALLLEALGGDAALPPPEHLLPALADAVDEARLALALGEAPPAGVAAIAADYERLLRERGAIDFHGMLTEPLRLFRECPEALRRCQRTYRCVLADEFQDVAAPQYALLRMLAADHGNLTVVGDVRQTLFEWRGADPAFLLGFAAAHAGARVVALEENFRSTGGILAVANAIGATLPYGGQLWTANPPGPTPTLHPLPDPIAEATFVAEEIARLLADGAVGRPGEVAALARTNAQTAPIRAALRQRDLACASEDAEHDGVWVGTIHAAKGQEWDAVFVIGMEDGLLPHRRALEDAASDASPDAVALAGETHAAYVAVTRPRERLYLTHCREREEPDPDGGTTIRAGRPSRFLDAVPAACLARAA